MAYDPKFNFSAGELAEELHERTNLDKYQTGLKTERNCVTTKLGTVLGKPGTNFAWTPYTYATKHINYAVPFTDYVVEVGDNYVRVRNTTTGGHVDFTPFYPYTEADLPYIHFSSYRNRYVYFFCRGVQSQRLDLSNVLGGPFGFEVLPSSPPVEIDVAETNITAVGTPGGYDIEYIATYIRDGQESIPPTTWSLLGKLPISNTQRNDITITLNRNDTEIGEYTQIYVYRRPRDGGEYLFVGASDSYTDTVPSPGLVDRAFVFKDVGQVVDPEHATPDTQIDYALDLKAGTNGGVDTYDPVAGIIYQDRMAFVGEVSQDLGFLTRTTYHNNMTRDYPLDADSALAIKPASSGNLRIIRLSDMGGLGAFTTQGLYGTANGALVPETAFMTFKGSWVPPENLPPLAIPGAFLVFDINTQSVMALKYAIDLNGFQGTELSIYSNHLFLGKNIVAWAYQEGEIPLVWIVFDDGTLASLTYQDEQLMRSWARSDTQGVYEWVIAHRNSAGVQSIYFSTLRNGIRSVEKLAPFRANDIKDYVGMDAAVSYKDEVTGATFTLTPVTPGVWDGPLTLLASAAVFANTANNGNVGTVFRFFAADKSSVDLTVTTFTNTTTLTVQPEPLFPSAQAVAFTGLFRTFNTFTGLGHIDGLDVAIMVDGYIEASPLNVMDIYPEYTVTGTQISLANGKRGAVVHIGLPFASDIETLDVDTVEQKPALLESILAKRMNIKVYKSLGFWVGNKFPANDTNEGMYNPHTEVEPEGGENPTPRPPQPVTRRYTFDIDGDWKSQGRICIRKVDPVPFELLSSIPDLQIEWRS